MKEIKTHCFLLVVLVLLFGNIVAQDKVTVSGYIQDKNTTEKLIGASVIIEGMNTGTASNTYGFYSLTIVPGKYSLRYSFVGYEAQIIILELKKDTVINVSLQTDLTIDEIVVTARSKSPGILTSTETGTNVVSVESIKKTPVIGGENDVLKTLQFLPGVKQSQEGTSGINVRGGSPDQNQIFLDGVPVYNASHLFGFLSVFNSDAINQVKLYKGGIPARYGGRLSSVLDISMKEGNNQTPKGVVSVSPISGRITLEGPIKPDTSSFIISGRRTFLDIPVRIGLLLTQPVQAGYYFYDYTAKANWKINSKNRMYFSSYLGRDRYFINYKEEGTKSDYSYNWGNVTSVLRWNTEISQKLFANFTGYYSHFYNKQKIKQKDEESFIYDISSGLNDFSLAGNFDYYPSPQHNIKFGFKTSFQSFSPQLVVLRGFESDTTFRKGVNQRAKIYSLYAEDDFNIGSRVRINAGIRADAYRTGKQNYYYIQPRFSARYLLSDAVSVKGSFSRMSQYLHLLSNTSVGLPTDLWVPSTNKTKPQEGWQTSFGLYFEPKPGFEFSAEGYYKEMENVIRFDQGASFLDSRQKSWEDNVITGKGLAYGTEFLVKKNTGKLKGWAGYTLSWSERKFEELNNGKPFPYRYDKRHDLSILGEYKFYDDGIDSKSLSFGFTFNTGYAVSIPDIQHYGLNILTEKGDHGYLGLFDYLETRVTYANPNNYRMPAFHHLDLGYHLTRKLSHFRSRTWSFSVYNIYNRLNPWYYYKNDDKLKQVSLFPIIPSVSFTYKW